MHGRWWLAFILVPALNGLTALASASPPDALWVPGLYDDADYDDVVSAVLSLEGLRGDSPPTLDRSVRVVAGVIAPAPAVPPGAPRPTPSSRAPPAS